MLDELNAYGKALSKEDKESFERLVKSSMKHISKVSYADSLHTWALVIISIMLELEKRMDKMEKEYESLLDGCFQEG